MLGTEECLGLDHQELVRRTRHVRSKTGRDTSTPCKEHEKVPGWMRILWVRATGLQPAGWGISTG